MGLIINYKHDEQSYENAYVQVKNINIQQNDYEFFQVIEKNEKLSEELTYIKRIDITYNYSIFTDKETRDKNCIPLIVKNKKIIGSHFDQNIFKIIYDDLKNLYKDNKPQDY